MRGHWSMIRRRPRGIKGPRGEPNALDAATQPGPSLGYAPFPSPRSGRFRPWAPSICTASWLPAPVISSLPRDTPEVDSGAERPARSWPELKTCGALPRTRRIGPTSQESPRLGVPLSMGRLAHLPTHRVLWFRPHRSASPASHQVTRMRQPQWLSGDEARMRVDAIGRRRRPPTPHRTVGDSHSAGTTPMTG